LPNPAAAGRDGLLADIRGGARLKKVSDAEKRDRSAAVIDRGAGGAGAAGAGAAAAAAATGAADGGMAGALASALAARKSKVAHSGTYCFVLVYGESKTSLTWFLDDEDDNDDWD
jgi:neural Wiskott-Aldrich syndrome protein